MVDFIRKIPEHNIIIINILNTAWRQIDFHRHLPKKQFSSHKSKKNKRESKKPRAFGGHNGAGFKSQLEYSEFKMTPWKTKVSDE